MATKNPIRIESKSLFINIEFDVEIPNQVSSTICKQICVFKNEDGTIGHEVDTHDYQNLVVMGKPASTDYRERNEFITTLKEVGIDVYKMLESASEEVLTPARIKNILKTVNLD